MVRRSYGQFCGLVRAMELVGERWALLIVRDLLVAPKRFTDLRLGLPRIPTNILSARLRELEEGGVVRRRVMPRPSGAVVYELTDYGLELEDIVFRLGRWGAKTLTEPQPGDIITTDAMVMAIRSAFQPEAARDQDMRYELRVGEVVIHAHVDHGRLSAGAGALPDADLVIETGPAIRALLAGELSPADAIANGSVRVTGDGALLSRFVQAFRL